MLNRLKTKNQGFTIIEVMIVLAIAGLIILIVLLAVPALQRNGRNTAIKNDASAVAAAISEYESNNDGILPVKVTGTGTITVCDASPTCGSVTKATAKVQGSTTAADQTGTGPGSTVITAGNVNVYLKVRCDGTTANRGTAVWYSVETSGTSVNKCIDT
jgi:prepilin-type N-terminal cleavage/methylation domain-containing protein